MKQQPCHHQFAMHVEGVLLLALDTFYYSVWFEDMPVIYGHRNVCGDAPCSGERNLPLACRHTYCTVVLWSGKLGLHDLVHQIQLDSTW